MKKWKQFLGVLLAVLLAAGTLNMPIISATDVQAFVRTSGSGEADTLEDTPEAEAVYEDLSEDADTEDSASGEAEISYTVTLDANGGWFVEEWDDILNETVLNTEVLYKVIPSGGTVVTFPVLERENWNSRFLGWSFERDGELITQEYEEYIPSEDCVLYACWESEEIIEEGAEGQDAEGSGEMSSEEEQALSEESGEESGTEEGEGGLDESEEGDISEEGEGSEEDAEQVEGEGSEED
ncbi:MAG: hypothetical protein Q4D81_08590, partial [Eubacteriales bacterium]|nr:hypothetical protein [Eubacteriales bacterium]